ncbi:MAG TPA: hypothetical protein VGN05_09535 [Parvibaculum sp.]|jgi:hypothetical protein
MHLEENSLKRAPVLTEAAAPVQPALKMRASEIHAIVAFMDIHTTLRIAYAVLAVSIFSLITVLGAVLFHFQLPGGFYKPLVILSYLWPAAAYAIATLRKRRDQN